MHRQLVQGEEFRQTKEMSEALQSNRKWDLLKYGTKYISLAWEPVKDESEKCPLNVSLDVKGTANPLLLTCVESFPGANRRLLASALQLMLPVQGALNLNGWQLFQLLKPLQFPETLSATARCEAWRALRLLQLYLHALCTFDVYAHKQLTSLDVKHGNLMFTFNVKLHKKKASSSLTVCKISDRQNGMLKLEHLRLH
jgi:hypothetical protein